LHAPFGHGGSIYGALLANHSQGGMARLARKNILILARSGEASCALGSQVAAPNEHAGSSHDECPGDNNVEITRFPVDV
jgi:hypothetical protein